MIDRGGRRVYVCAARFAGLLKPAPLEAGFL